MKKIKRVAIHGIYEKPKKKNQKKIENLEKLNKKMEESSTWHAIYTFTHWELHKKL